MSGDTLDFLQGNRETLTGTLHDPAATPGDVLTVQADKSIAAAPGVVVPVPAQANYGGNAVNIGNNSLAPLTINTKFSGPDLLDFSVPAVPVFAAAGTYAVAVLLAGDALTAGGYAVGTMQSGFGAGAYTQDPTEASGWGLSGVAVRAQGEALIVSVRNRDGVSARDFHITQALIVKLA